MTLPVSIFLCPVLASAAPITFQSAKWTESGLRTSLGYRPHALAFEDGLSADVKNPPADLKSPRYAKIVTGPKDAPLSHLVIVDFEDNVAKRLFIDSKGDGDFSDDTAFGFTTKVFDRPDGIQTGNEQAAATINLTGDGKLRGAFNFYSIRSDISQPAAIPKNIGYYTDFGVTGEVDFGGKAMKVTMPDDTATSVFVNTGVAPTSPLLWIDANNNNKTDRGESAPVSALLNIEGKWWKVATLETNGNFTLEETTQPVAEAEEPSKIDAGMTAPSFTAKTVDGKTVNFPGDYKGKVVLIDFWATWCGPCVAEIPNVVKAYGTYHDQGLEILGISLDKEDMAEKIATFTTTKGMPWPQVYDGKLGGAEVAKTYGIHSIPHMLLVDGDTGVVLANETIRGEELAPAIEKALASKKK